MSFSWQNVWLPFVALSGVASGTLLAGAFARHGTARWSERAPEANLPDISETSPSGSAPHRLASERLDAEKELVSIARDVAGLAAERFVRVETAIQPGLGVWADKAALRQMLAVPLRAAVARSGGGRVLVGAGHRAGRVQISVLDDGVLVERAVLEAELRDTTRLVAMHGGTLEVTVRPNAGTKVVIRLPEPAAAPTPASVPVGASAPQATAQGALSARAG